MIIKENVIFMNSSAKDRNKSTDTNVINTIIIINCAVAETSYLKHHNLNYQFLKLPGKK